MKELLTNVEENPTNVALKMELVKKYIDSQDYNAAKDVLLQVISLDSRNLDANFILGQLHEFDEEYSDAINCFEIIHSQVQTVDNKYKLAQLYELNDDYEKSLTFYNQCYNEAPKDSPQSLDFVEKLAHVNHVLGNSLEAIEFYNILHSKNPNNIVALTQLLELYEADDKYKYYSIKGQIKEIEKTYSHAVNAYNKALEEASSDDEIIETRCSLARCYKFKENIMLAIDEYQAILEKKHDNIIVLKNLAELLIEADRNEDAIEAYVKALVVDENNIEIMQELAELYLDNKNAEHALPLYEKLVNIAPDNNTYNIGISKTYIALNRDKDAEEKLNILIEKEPKNVEILGVLIDFYILTKQHQKALDSLEEIKKLIPKSPFGFKKSGEIYERLGKQFESHCNFGVYHDLKGEKQLAIDEFNWALDMSPDNLEIIERLARLHAENSDEFVAIDYYQRIYDADRSNITVLKKIADLYLKKGEYKNALSLYEDIISSSKDNIDAEIYYCVAEVYEKLKKYNQAKAKYQLYVDKAKLSPKVDDAKYKIEKLSIKIEQDKNSNIFKKIARLFS